MYKKYIFFFNYKRTKKIDKTIFFKNFFLKKPYSHILITIIQFYSNTYYCNVNIFAKDNLILLNYNLDLYEIYF